MVPLRSMFLVAVKNRRDKFKSLVYQPKIIFKQAGNDHVFFPFPQRASADVCNDFMAGRTLELISVAASFDVELRNYQKTTEENP